MTLLGIQSRMREIGRIRTGEVVEKGGKSYPSRLDTFRLTSSDRAAIEAAAERYGGTVGRWKDGWEVVTESDRLDVMLPARGAAEPYSLYYELWSGGGIQRRCDGTTMVAGGDEDGFCLCDPEARLCAPTLRVPFFLPDLPGLGTWRLESKSYNAAAEMPGALNLLATWAQQGRPTRAVLRLEKRETKHEGKKRQFTVPVLDPVGTLNAMFLNQPERPALAMLPEGTDRPLLPHELDSFREDPVGDPVLPEPSDAAVREEAGVLSNPQTSGEAAAVDSPPAAAATPSRYRRGELAEKMTAKSISLEGLQEYLTLLGITSQQLSDDEMDRLLDAIDGHGTDEPLDLGVPSDPPAPAEPPGASGEAVAPPKPGTDAYRALAPLDKANARSYWTEKDLAKAGLT